MKKCPRGTIRRKAYTRKAHIRKNGIRVKSTKVPASCIKDLGKKGKGKKLFTLKKGDLSKYGYSLKKNKDLRHKSLKKSMNKFGKNTLIRKLNALHVLHKNTNPNYSRKARSDMKWIQSQKK